ncbi:ubiquinone/menaquinone biosynthesis C-methylase UbiE [Paenibacillus sp. DS2015]|uniref:class I SAM-dependent methyltransferase n=1 Tax=Paenibacillus sp. DS2015 TaxID=3373917 RepID=UPI003D1D27B9
MEKEKIVRIFDKQAKQYENRKEGSTLRQWRQKLLQDADGEVLELAVGAGANFPFYPSGVKITATDISPEMLKKAKQASKVHNLQTKFVLSDIEELEFADHSFDTIVSTLSLCCYENPLKVLNKLNSWCSPEGKILLMEHGISSNIAYSTAQKVFDPLLYRFIGCHHARDMQDLLQKSGLTMIRVESYWMDTVKLIWAHPSRV